MDIRNCYFKPKSEVDKTRDIIMENTLKSIGYYNTYYLGQLDLIKNYSKYMDQSFYNACLKIIKESDLISDEVVKLAELILKELSDEKI